MEDSETSSTEVAKSKMWDLPIFEIKIGGSKDGLGFRIGQTHRDHVICDIIRDVINNEVVYQIFGKKDGKIKLMKASSGLGVYLTFSVE
jgi:hypothetical protein